MTVPPSPGSVSEVERPRRSSARALAVLRRATEPSPSVTALGGRRRARLLAALVLAAAPTALLASTALPMATDPAFDLLANPGALIGVAASASLTVVYFLARSRHYEWGARIVVCVAVLAVWAAALANIELNGIATFFFVATSVLFASLLLTVRQTAAVAAVNLVGLFALPFVVPGVTAKLVVLPISFFALTSVLILVAAAVRERDAREREEADERLREQYDLYETLVDAHDDLGEGVAVSNGERFLYVNGALARILARSREDLLAEPSAILFASPGSRPDIEAARERLLAGDAAHFEIVAERPDGTSVDVEIAATASQGSGAFRVVSIIRDVTERKAAELELEASRRRMAMSEKLSALGTLVAGVGHEINNPLAFMRGTVELGRTILEETLARDDLPAEARAALLELLENEEVVLRGIERIDHITTSLKRVARGGSAGRTSEDVNALLDSVLTVAAPRVRGRIRLTRDFRATKHALVNASEASQVFLNLIFNAIDAMGEEGDLVVRSTDSDGRVIVEVTDTGPGISPEAAKKIFVPFHTTKPNGTGLGLSLSYRIVEDHGGRLSFTSRTGQGTTFRVELPASVLPGLPGTA